MYRTDWVGNCSDPKYVYEQLAPTISDILDSISLVHEYGFTQHFASEIRYQLGPNVLKLESLPWKVTGNYVSLRCYHLDMSSIKNMTKANLKFINIFSHNPYVIHVGSPNAWKKIDPVSNLRMSDFVDDSGKTVLLKLNVAIDVMHMKDYAGKPCNGDVDYDYDKCIAEEVDR